MKKFDYVVSSEKGVKSKGFLMASSEQDAIQKLKEKGDIIISIMERVQVQTRFWEKPSLSLQEKLMFTKHLSTMIKVGITVTEAFEILISQTRGANNRKMFSNILEKVRSGQTLANSLRDYENVFSEIFVNMISTGEESGTLEKVLEYLDVQIEKEYELRKKVVSAFIYPGVIISVTILLTFGIVVFIMPKITDVFTSFDVVLPLPTRILMGFSKFIEDKPLVAFL
ncbi:MAG: type II secretion system F family protein, partial [Candidatus Peregrinibacteria bacterium]|nr:type II secretion system F family protein [Candidatus Peregrinibacteria bacterium]